ncbi:MAG: DUF177 domain-containing protein [Lachnospiraceae bacterium]|nr:DUF177 domain-containing protein [Lachnospiraceae bacterium]
MLLDLTEYLNSEGKKETVKVRFEAGELVFSGQSYPVSCDEDFDLVIENTGKGSISINGNGKLKVTMICDRCLGSVEKEISADIEDRLEQSDITDPEPGEQRSYLEGYVLDTDELIKDAAFIAMPMKVLCREDCKGLCSVCGRNLNEGECGCDRFVPSPGMAAIGEIFAAANRD